MINWLKQKFTKTVVVYRIPDYMLEPCYKDGFWTVIGWRTDDSKPLYEVGCFYGKLVVANYETFIEIVDIGEFLPISIQALDPDAPLTSSIMAGDSR